MIHKCAGVQEEKAKPGLTAARAEELLVLCAKAIEKRDVTAAQQAVHALQSISSVDGELPSERVTAYFLRALMIRASSLLQSSQNLPPELDPAQYMQDNPHRKYTGTLFLFKPFQPSEQAHWKLF